MSRCGILKRRNRGGRGNRGNQVNTNNYQYFIGFRGFRGIDLAPCMMSCYTWIDPEFVGAHFLGI